MAITFLRLSRARLWRRAVLAGLMAALGSSGAAHAQEGPFPSRPIRILVPTAVGGNLDLLGRLLAEKMQQAWGLPVVVESRAGANTMLATQAVQRSAPDGYTALFTISGFVQNLVLLPNPPYKASDFAPVSMVAVFPIALAANASLPANTLQEVVKLARDKPDTISYGEHEHGT